MEQPKTPMTRDNGNNTGSDAGNNTDINIGRDTGKGIGKGAGADKEIGKDAGKDIGKGTGTEIPEANRPQGQLRRGVLIPELMATLKRFEKIGDTFVHQRVERQIEEAAGNEKLMREILSQIAVIAFIGSSGSGKSTRAIQVARDNAIHYMIDDGLLINGSRIIAGTSAKKAKTKLDSVRQALFADKSRSEVMRRALAEHRPTAVMILGTSDAMLEKICTNLWLPHPAMLIRIEDISTEDEMQQAKQTRLAEGLHTIPVPSMEIKHEFSGYFSDPLNRIRRRLDRERGVPTVAPEIERTMVRPTFSSLGSYSISDDALLDLVRIILRKIPGVHDVLRFRTEKRVYGFALNVDLELIYGYSAQDTLLAAQERIGRYIEEYSSINTVAVDVRARRLVHARSEPMTGEGENESSTGETLPPENEAQEER
ncbi:MAG: Asp23/Gls24 family envelope stress response protein [Clostridiales bacterium]|nr:Asp23/Gls24 family envelope stress response protein [Clostridiales bacterium]